MIRTLHGQLTIAEIVKSIEKISRNRDESRGRWCGDTLK